MYWAQPLKWYSFRARRIRKRLNKFLDLVEDNREYVTEELIYPIYKVYNHSNMLSIKQLNLTKLPVIETIQLLHVTQVSCKPLEFEPRKLNRT